LHADQREHFFRQLPGFESTLVDEGIVLIKIWLNVGRAEQLRRMLDARIRSAQAMEAVADRRGRAGQMGCLYRRHPRNTGPQPYRGAAPWTVIRSDDKNRARLAVVQTVLRALDYAPRTRRAPLRPTPPSAAAPRYGMAKQGYHHGNLRQALVDACLKLIENRGRKDLPCPRPPRRQA
jgi:polyphosphate kinase